MTSSLKESKPHFELMHPEDAVNRPLDFLMVDVRSVAEFEESHIEGSVLEPLGQLDANRIKTLIGDNKRCLLICRTGGRASQAAEILYESGIPSVAVLDGGVTAWKSKGYPLKYGKKMVSLERQVRIVAGALVFIGTVLGYFVSPTWLVVPVFVGLGLVFSGVSDTCGMALILARMPWNTRVKCSI